MKFSTFVALAALSAATPVWSAGGDAAAGQAKAAVCAACHSVDGNSVDPLYPKIAGQHADYIAQQLALFKSGKRMNPIMLGISATLTEQDMLDLAAYFATQKPSPGLADEALMAVGQQIYQAGDAKRNIPACMSCHGPTGHGNPMSGYPSIAGQHAQYSADLLRRFRGGAVYGEVTDANAKIMSQVAVSLTDAEIEALASYLQGLSSATP
jgi:cytochrome c553